MSGDSGGQSSNLIKNPVLTGWCGITDVRSAAGIWWSLVLIWIRIFYTEYFSVQATVLQSAIYDYLWSGRISGCSFRLTAGTSSLRITNLSRNIDNVLALLAHLLYHLKVFSAQYVDVLSDVRTSRKQHVGWFELIQMVIYRLISLALTIRRSSSSIRGEHPSRRGNKALKRSLFLTAFAALIAPISRAYYTNDIARCLSP